MRVIKKRIKKSKSNIRKNDKSFTDLLYSLKFTNQYIYQNFISISHRGQVFPFSAFAPQKRIKEGKD